MHYGLLFCIGFMVRSSDYLARQAQNDNISHPVSIMRKYIFFPIFFPILKICL